jgi:hypothetical protein
MKNENGEDLITDSIAGTSSADMVAGFAKNNYSRPAGQNVGARGLHAARSPLRCPALPVQVVLLSSISATQQSRGTQAPAPMPLPQIPAWLPFSRAGNMITDRSSSRVLAPPGGSSSIVFGDATNGAPAPAPAAKAPIATAAAGASMPAAQKPQPGSLASLAGGEPTGKGHNNNYSRPEGQNVGALFG